ncbi:preprotein translocase subunit SecA [Dethiothermospora halolimnae]|uniref:preprotein translocase subunit SecA n=1 Tax=Dethiothermospora halolimnae TaxID=3114390 RepID=UPI003CCB853F
MKNILGNIFNIHDSKLKKIKKRVDNILDLENKISGLTDEELKAKTTEFREKLKSGEDLDNILEEAFAVVREASYRVLGMKHFPVQLMGGIVLHDGNIAEMKTGEGKTLVSTLPAYLNGLSEDSVFIVTVNEYLASRDREEMGKVHEFLGLKVGLIKREMTPAEKKEAYSCDIVYGTNSEFGFDYLRDNMAVIKDNVVQKNRNFVIIDEVDSVLIDEARTPLIISGQGNRPSQYYMTVDKFVRSLKEEDYDIDSDKNSVNLTESGMDKGERVFNLENIADIENIELLHHIRQSLHAHNMMKRDQDYVIKDGEVVIVDKFTGRLMPGRRYSKGLHQAIEAKEGLDIQKESKTVATITYQNYFRMFDKVAGMTGTAYTEREEFKSIYGMDVYVIPTNKPTIRKDSNDIIYMNRRTKFKSIVQEIEKRHRKGQPVLVGTIYIDESEKISDMLKKRSIKHELLNAKQDEDEANIIAAAGEKNAVTIATNMAGRGTDIKLGEGVSELGGLFVIGAERHNSRRIDNQLRGRAGRQGDPGESQFFISLEDSLFEGLGDERIEKMKKTFEKYSDSEEEGLQNKILSSLVESTQKNIESINYSIRKNTLEFDQILNKQRETIYNERNKILNGEDMGDFIVTIIEESIIKAVDHYTMEGSYPEEWDLKGLENYLKSSLGFKDEINFKDLPLEEIEKLDRETIKKNIIDKGLNIYNEKKEKIDKNSFKYIERLVLMRNIDKKWMEHLDVIEQLRQGIGFQGVGGDKPIRIFNREAFNLFENMYTEIAEATIKHIFSLVTKEEIVKEEKKKNEKDRRQRILDLEDKYKVNRKQLPNIPANLPSIKFNVNINATDKVKGKISLYYLENGYEEKVKGYDGELLIEGAFPVELPKPKDKNWEKGWYQVKVFVLGEEASNINFIVTDEVDLNELDKKKSSDIDISKIRFFSKAQQNISFNVEIKDSNKGKIQGAILYRNKSIIKFEAPIKDNKVKINIEKPKNGWPEGMYQLILNVGDKNMAIPFIVAEEVNREDEHISIPININLEGEDISSVKLKGQFIDIDKSRVMKNISIEIKSSNKFNISINKPEKGFSPGRYQFRIGNKNELIYTKNFIIK